MKGYADDVTLISTNIDTHSYVLKENDKRAADLDLMLKPSKCVSFLFNGAKHPSQGIPLSNGTTIRQLQIEKIFSFLTAVRNYYLLQTLSQFVESTSCGSIGIA